MNATSNINGTVVCVEAPKAKLPSDVLWDNLDTTHGEMFNNLPNLKHL